MEKHKENNLENNVSENENLIAGHTDLTRTREGDAQSVEDIIKLLDDYTISGGSRMKLNVVEGNGELISKQYHHGRCDVGSPWARGEAFDVLED